MRPRLALLAALSVAFLAACNDAPTSPMAATPRLSQGSNSGGVNSGSGGGGSSGGGGGTNVVPPPAIPPAVVIAGTWTTTVIGGLPAGVTRTVTMTLVQATGGTLTGSIANRQQDGVIEPVTGTVSGNDVTVTIGNVCGKCTLEPVFIGTSATGATLDGSLLVLAFTPVTFTKV